ncbi:MAG: hypothetical protein HN590_15180 [Calditrichaeota bacterium]|nr:hypothetical protein [Calditrichota bacterium]
MSQLSDQEQLNNGSIDFEKITEILIRNGTAIVPVDTVYGLIARAFNSTSLSKLDEIKKERSLPYTAIFDSVNSFFDWYGEVDWIRRGIIESLLPGPVTIIVPEPDSVKDKFRYGNHGIGVRVTSDSVITDITRHVGSPVWATSVNRSGKQTPTKVSEIDADIIKEADYILDTGPTIYGQASTTLDIRNRPFNVLRKGPRLEEVESVLKDSEKPFEILVICTGNTCRSPIAAEIIQHGLGTLEESGIIVRSAGTNAVNGYPATDKMVTIANGWGIDLSSHHARQITRKIIEDSDLILPVSPSHLDLIVSEYENSQSKTRLFGELINRNSIPDPYQLSFSEYESSAELILKAGNAWIEEIKKMLPQDVRPLTRSEATGVSS